MFERRLLALGYPNYQNFKADDEHEYRRLVLWLEEQRIRHYQVADREAIREIDGDKWQGQFELYLKSLDCPYVGNHVQALSWLLGTALQLEEQSGISDKNPHHQDAFTNIDVQSHEFSCQVDKICETLKIPAHPNPTVRLEACQKLLNSRMGMKQGNEDSTGGVEVNLQEHDFGFTDKSMDPVLRDAAKILRMLHLAQLRKLQSDINNTIELVQSVTANPKTDTKLGKVGR